MMISKSNYCPFGNDISKCSGYSTDAFKNIICAEHLEKIYGLTIVPHIRTNEMFRYTVGPFLMPAYKTSFQPNTVIFPDSDFFDLTFDTSNTQSNHDYKYKLNRNIMTHIYEIVKTKNLSSQEMIQNRIHTQIIRNVSVPDPQAVTSFQVKDNSTLTTVQNMLTNLKHTINNHVYKPLYDKIDLLDSNVMAADGTQPKASDKDLSAFSKFMMVNMLHAFHSCDKTDPKMYAATILPNVQYKKGIGFVTLSEIANGDYLVLLSHEMGTPHLYHTKVYEEQFQTRELGSKTMMGETVHIHNSILANCSY